MGVIWDNCCPKSRPCRQGERFWQCNYSRGITAVIVYADIVCPFADIGLTRLLQRRDELGRPDVHLQIRSWPHEIVNGKPVDGAFIGDEIDEITPQVAQDLFAGFKVSAFPASTRRSASCTPSAFMSVTTLINDDSSAMPRMRPSKSPDSNASIVIGVNVNSDGSNSMSNAAGSCAALEVPVANGVRVASQVQKRCA